MLFSNNKNRKKLLATLAIAGVSLCILLLGRNYDFYVVVSDSMIPNLNTGDVVIIDDNNAHSSFAHLGIGDIIVFEVLSDSGDFEQGKTIVHRVEQIGWDSEGQKVIRTKGDATPYSIQGVDYPITRDNYVGKVVYVIPYLGLLLMYLNLLVQIIMQPIFYFVIGAVIATIVLLEYQKRRGF